ncbi:MAG: biotin/lipoyl-binding protein, partial [Oceanospirillales bacterium]|nr:biotin/lipoyl-binding protein [Oceanospirillales bacterium]
MKKLLVSCTLLGLLAFALYWFNRPAPIDVRLTEVQPGLVEQIAANSRAGTIRACRRSRLSMPRGGRVERLLVSEGEHVEQGQPLLELWHADLSARVEEVAATLKARTIQTSAICMNADLARREARRTESLAQQQLASEELLDQRRTEARRTALACDEARALTEQAQATLKLNQVLLDDTV